MILIELPEGLRLHIDQFAVLDGSRLGAKGFPARTADHAGDSTNDSVETHLIYAPCPLLSIGVSRRRFNPFVLMLRTKNGDLPNAKKGGRQIGDSRNLRSGLFAMGKCNLCYALFDTPGARV